MPVGRDLGLDAFRGVTVLLMVVVNLQGDGSAAFPLLKHAVWNGLTLADLVFPWFVLIVGLSVPLALDGRRDVTVGAVAKRVSVLFVIGVALDWLIRPTLDVNQVRWVGVLQRIAIVYLACSVVARLSSGCFGAAIIAAACLVAHTAILLLVTAPGETAPSMVMGHGVSGWLDRVLIPGRLHRGTWDPEGALSTLSSIGTALAGVSIARWRRGGAKAPSILSAASALAVGLALTALVPLNKALWTASYALVASGSGIALWFLLSRVASTGQGRRLLALPVFAGQTAFTLYVVHMLVVALLVRSVEGGTVWSITFDTVEQVGLPGGVASLVFAIVAVGVSLAPLPWLRRRGLLLRA